MEECETIRTGPYCLFNEFTVQTFNIQALARVVRIKVHLDNHTFGRIPHLRVRVWYSK